MIANIKVTFHCGYVKFDIKDIISKEMIGAHVEGTGFGLGFANTNFKKLTSILLTKRNIRRKAFKI